MAFIFLKSEYLITASPLSTSCPLYEILIGIFLNVLALFVITSPTIPFPLVTAFSRVPLLYVKTTVSPSSFHDKSAFLSPANEASVATSFVLSRDNIGLSCVSFCNSLITS